MLLELHAHSSQYSKCSHVDPVSLIRQVKRKALQGVILTEHHYLWKDSEIASLRSQAEIEDTFLILAGQEVETDIGHVLVFGADRSIEEFIKLEDLRNTFPDAALVWAHPFRDGRITGKEGLQDPLLDAIEIFSMNQTVKENYLGLKFWHQYKFTAVSGSDAHSEETAGIFPTQFDHPVTTITEVAKEIKNSRCRPFFKEIPHSGSNIVVTEIIIGAKGEDETRNRMILKEVPDTKKWEKTQETINIVKTLYSNGFGDGQFRVPKIIDINNEEKFLIEEGQRGRSLYELLLHVSPSIGVEYFKLSAQWLAKLHNMKLRLSNIEDGFNKEIRKFDSYRNSFLNSNNPYRGRIDPIITLVKEKEEAFYKDNKGEFTQSHGDFHPRNIIVGQDMMQDASTIFISVIDFDNSAVLPRVFDVGYFLAQFQSQFFRFPRIIDTYKESDFIDAYLKDSGDSAKDLEKEVLLFKLRANLSIASYLIKVGKGESPEMRSVIERSESLRFLLDKKA